MSVTSHFARGTWFDSDALIQPILVGTIANMKASLMMRQRRLLEGDLIAEIVIWDVPEPVRGSQHLYKYRLALVEDDICVMRYDNEAGKGDHKHLGALELAYKFSTVSRLLDDFRQDCEMYQKRRVSR